ncbi:30S ribosomal protein S1 [Campylobacter sp. RM9929]|uniref:30S ribosomal protein S1 n=1 Tax=Campylobacter TaxID=194 RepID=UPI001908E824|nr:30S ribosomal protein S1 [Campylobacter sp. 2018MI35]MBZ7929360.1 30S ribosomal protein S1 [Campylobacter sp. W0067]MBZ7940784.1 30S ribosomal protein S1 [Campylobacter sp. W0047]MBZ7947412.1 30S ribosomal protein S1 [Campylobacter sp. RM9929]MBZ7949230.1 30S ribosomal protein S1 [Campylobacter sp. RM10534]MBZ7960651.1 30S ribosomal protein S1 [Campylobacter sp. RM9930]MBZ7962123.1 30S ribosomal protein S1 [Campylobacter sp. W0049]MBZ7965158.1 30S ribosomal protein S1 [Campylobacter sp. R
MIEANNKVQSSLDDFLEEEDFGQLLDAFDKSKEEAMAEGVIVEIKNDEVYIDIGKKSEGILPIAEIQNNDGQLLFKIGDKIKVAVVGYYSGRSLLSHKKALRKEKVIGFIKNYKEEDSENIFNVKVVGKNKGGLIVVDDNDIEFFLPKSQYGFKENNNVLGKTFKVKIIKIDHEEQSIIVSRKKTLDDERKRRKELINNITQEQGIIEGTVKKITTYGMFVDVGGIDGLVHYSEISYKGPVNPSLFYKEGDKVPVKIISYNKERKHLSLSIKAALPDPWSEIKDNLEVGDTIKVIVSNIEPYGAFVDLGNDIEGFLHISEISWDKNIKNPKDHISKGQEIDVEVIEINSEERRLRVSLRNLLTKPFDEFLKKYKLSDILEGEVTLTTAFGAFINLGMIEGLLHNEDASWSRTDKCKDKFKVGDKVRVKIIKIDTENQKISLSMKELCESPVQEYAKNHKVGDIVKGKIRDIKDFGVFVELSQNVDALIHKEDISTSTLENLKIDDEIEAAIVFIDEKKNRIRLSVKNLVKMKEREVLNEINDNDKITLGDIIKDQLA